VCGQFTYIVDYQRLFMTKNSSWSGVIGTVFLLSLIFQNGVAELRLTLVLRSRVSELRLTSGFKLKTNIFSFLGWRTQAANHNRRHLLTLGATLVLFFGGWVFGVLSPMADHSGQTTRERVKPVDVSSTLTLFCEITPIYTLL